MLNLIRNKPRAMKINTKKNSVIKRKGELKIKQNYKFQ